MKARAGVCAVCVSWGTTATLTSRLSKDPPPDTCPAPSALQATLMRGAARAARTQPAGWGRTRCGSRCAS